VIIFRVLPHIRSADVFEYLDFDAQQTLLAARGTRAGRRFLNEEWAGRFSDGAAGGKNCLARPRDNLSIAHPEEQKRRYALLGYQKTAWAV
jgi:hypothetical protein